MYFVKSAFSEMDYLNDKHEVCLVGRSNVGKSSLINALANKKIALVSSKPGRTQLANYYDFDKYYLVDLPGYGYNKLSKIKQDEIVYVFENYLAKAQKLKAIFQVVDANVVTELDQAMSFYFNKLNHFHYVIINKIDKQNKDLHHQVNKIASYLKVDVKKVIAVSASKNKNIKQLKGLIDKVMIA